ncbi:glycosyltransferase [Polaribacter aquimarinus]|uniref:Glycosyl transferase family 2 n=1 Tax=Polaribacter aquimarinus TaxID=2100726 RepID=A0A2U2JB87_9FLAO|nr:glycosyltransferase [Polaribacter aquimarinus]PWG05594.1 glycosyl transferase family 2 [Polaribacter aquimarinus]
MITASIVLFNNDIEILRKTIDSFLKIQHQKKLYLIDNSKTNVLKDIYVNDDVEYIFVGKNIGFGSAHNLILNKINSKFHLILNPDVEFSVNVIPDLILELENKPDVSFISPKVIYPNKELQHICRRHPSFFDLINRRLNIFKIQVFKNEYRNKNLEQPFYPDFIHGCFMLFKTKDLQNLKGFDERYFLYMEDADICRKIDKLGKKKLYFPKVKIIHQHQKGSSKHLKLFFYHLSSAIKYFLKWGF